MCIRDRSCSQDEVITYKLSVTVTPNGAGNVNPSSGVYDANESVTINVSSSSDYIFDKWSGDWIGSNSPLTLVMDSDKTLIANFKIPDDDNDGVPNKLDQCGDTISGQSVDSNGCATSQLDSDNDGISDDIDQDNTTRADVPVDANGVMKNPVYLDDNGVTIKAYDWSIVGDMGTVDGKEYTIVSLEMLKEMLQNNDNVTGVCTSKIARFNGVVKSGGVDDSGFFEPNFNQNIRSWDTSNSDSMRTMFS